MPSKVYMHNKYGGDIEQHLNKVLQFSSQYLKENTGKRSLSWKKENTTARTRSRFTPLHSIFTWCTGSYPVDSEIGAWPGTHSEVSGRGQSCEGMKGNCYTSTRTMLWFKFWPKCWWGGSAPLRGIRYAQVTTSRTMGFPRFCPLKMGWTL